MPTIDISYNGRWPVRHWNISAAFIDKLNAHIKERGYDTVITVVGDDTLPWWDANNDSPYASGDPAVTPPTVRNDCIHPGVFARGPVPGTEHCYTCGTDIPREQL